jgi:hypothetical protein
MTGRSKIEKNYHSANTMSNYNEIKQRLGFTSERQFRDALVAAGINPKQAEASGIPASQIAKIAAPQKALPDSAAIASLPAAPRQVEEEPKVSIEQVQQKLGVDPETMVLLCREFGLSENRPLAQSEAMALCELAMDMYGGQLEQGLVFVEDRQALLSRQQQDIAYQIGYLQEAAISTAEMRGRLDAQQKRLGKREEQVRKGQEQVFSLLGDAGKLLKPQGESATQAHQEFTLGLWA